MVIRATAWTVIATYAGQVLRLISNLILTRLLFPEAFGVMGILLLIIQSLNLFSDIGIQQSLILSPLGYERRFCNTAWTIQIIRGVCLWLAACAIAGGLSLASLQGWLPPGSAFADPRLPMLLPVAALSLIAIGFTATRLSTLRRELKLGVEATFQLSYQLVQMILIVVWAWLAPSVWALVGGTVVCAFLAAIASHYVVPGVRNRIDWDSKAAKDLIRFGRYILVSTMFTFLAVNAQRVILGGMLPADQFGVFTIALALSTFILMAMDRLHGAVLFPLYSELSRSHTPDAMAARIRQVRIGLLALSLPPMCIVVLLGPHVVAFLYDARYHEAGWMLRLLGAAAIVAMMSMTLRPVILAHGDAGRQMAFTAITAVMLCVCMAIGASVNGVPGVLAGSVVAEVIAHLLLLVYVRKYGIRTALLDLGMMGLAALIVIVGVAVAR